MLGAEVGLAPSKAGVFQHATDVARRKRRLHHLAHGLHAAIDDLHLAVVNGVAVFAFMRLGKTAREFGVAARAHVHAIQADLHFKVLAFIARIDGAMAHA
ncbi:hypothetical protein D3C85_1712540 [compost metagenome]